MEGFGKLLENWGDMIASLFDEPADYRQWAWVLGSLLFAAVLSKILSRFLSSEGSGCSRFCQRFFRPKHRIGTYPIVAALTLWAAQACNQASSMGGAYVQTMALLATAYAFYRLARALSKNTWAPRLIGGFMLFAFALHLFGALQPLINLLQKISIPIGSSSVTIWAILSGTFSLFLFLWIASLATLFIDNAVRQQKEVPPSMRVLIGKIARFLFYLVAILLALKIGGADLRGLTVFTGALGLGLGFGLQKVISNLISGVIILLDKSVKPGDVIEIEGAYGWINSLRTRYVSVITRDRKEYLIPNENFITNPVINWSFSDENIRIRANIGIGYSSDVEQAIALCVKATSAVSRVLDDPAPKCLLVEFGDSSINLQIRFWIKDAQDGVANVRSAVLLNVWREFKEADIEIPFPQRDVNIRSINSLAQLSGTSDDQ